MIEEKLKGTASDDLDDLLRQVELSFDIKFGYYELQYVNTFGELCDIIERKIQLTDVQSCTSQQAFYKLRKALEISNAKSEITPASALTDLLPTHNRKLIWRSVEQQLGFKLNVIGMSSTLSVILFFAFFDVFCRIFH